jgi:hypothetical protein
MGTRSAAALLAAFAMSALAGTPVSCSSLPRKNAVPDHFESKAAISGLADVRYVVGNQEDMERLVRDVVDSWARERSWIAAQGKPSSDLPPTHFLALSGGGDKGAFGAGLLNGWSAAGNRPEFKLVTGISTGGLIAPFAFLGPRYDEKLRNLYTNVKRDDIVTLRGLLTILTDDSLADTAPLRKLLRKHVDRNFLDEIAVEHRKGRELWISTTNLDARKRVIWNMTKLAASDHPRAVEIFQEVMIASAHA